MGNREADQEERLLWLSNTLNELAKPGQLEPLAPEPQVPEGGARGAFGGSRRRLREKLGALFWEEPEKERHAAYGLFCLV